MMRKKIKPFAAAALVLILLLALALTAACGRAEEAADPGDSPASQSDTNESSETAPSASEKKGTGKMKLLINGTEMPVTWEDNASVDALKELGGTTIQMSMYGGNEQVGPIGKTLPSDDVQTTTRAGDIVLYSSDQIVVFYGSNTWAYTRLGHIDMSEEEMTELLGNGDVTLEISN